MYFFCENPKCKWHKPANASTMTYMKVATYSDLKAGPPPLGVVPMSQQTEIRGRQTIVKHVEGVEISGTWCDVCVEAIKSFEGFG